MVAKGAARRGKSPLWVQVLISICWPCDLCISEFWLLAHRTQGQPHPRCLGVQGNKTRVFFLSFTGSESVLYPEQGRVCPVAARDRSLRERDV